MGRARSSPASSSWTHRSGDRRRGGTTRADGNSGYRQRNGRSRWVTLRGEACSYLLAEDFGRRSLALVEDIDRLCEWTPKELPTARFLFDEIMVSERPDRTPIDLLDLTRW